MPPRGPVDPAEEAVILQQRLAATIAGGRIEAAVRLYEELSLLGDKHPGVIALAEAQAEAAHDLLFAWLQRGLMDQAARLLFEIELLAEDHPASTAIAGVLTRLRQALHA